MGKSRSYWFRAGILSFGERFAQLLFGFGSLWMLLRMWSVEEFGHWVIFLSVTTLIEIARVGLLQNALVKFLSTTSEEMDYRRINTASLVLNILLGGIVVLLVMLLAIPLSRILDSALLVEMLPVYGLTTLFLIPMHQANFSQQANLDFRGIFWGNLTNRGIFFLFIVLAFVGLLELDPLDLSWIQVLTTAMGAGISAILAKPYLRFSRQVSWAWVKKLFHFGKYVCGTNLGTMLFKSIDKLMLAALISPAAAAVYEVAIRITNLAEVPTFSMAAIVFPQSARQHAMDDFSSSKVRELYEKSVAGILAFLIPGIILVMAFPGLIIRIVAGAKYLDAIPLLQLTMLYGLFVPFAVQFGTILDSTGHPKVNFIYTSMGALTNILCNYVFISYFGIVGAAYGTLFTLLVMFILMQLELNKRFEVRLSKVILNIPYVYQQLWQKVRPSYS